MHLPRCGIFSDSPVGMYVWLFDLRKNMRLYEGSVVLYLFADLLVPLGSLDWWSGIWTFLVSWNDAGSTCWISNWRIICNVTWIETWQFIWHMGRIFFWVSLGALDGLMIGTWKGCFVGWSLVLPLGSPLGCPNPVTVFDYLSGSMDVIILGMYLGNTLGYLIDYICNINWYGPCLGALQLFLHFYWIPSLPVIWLGTWHTDWHTDGTFTWKLAGKVSWIIYRI